jgi:hypothetical protein
VLGVLAADMQAGALWRSGCAQSQATGASTENPVGMASPHGSGQTLARPAGEEGQGGDRGFQQPGGDQAWGRC